MSTHLFTVWVNDQELGNVGPSAVSYPRSGHVGFIVFTAGAAEGEGGIRYRDIQI